jgi:spore coat polysaccharide biosynthesis protein SpsF
MAAVPRGGVVILGILQARMSSTRLPGKVLAPVLGTPMIGRQLERLRRSRRLDQLVVATSEGPDDDALADYCRSLDVPVVRGSLTNVLQRFCSALAQFPDAEVVVRLTADCPLADWQVVDAVVDRHLETGADYTDNLRPVRTFPHGLDVEAVSPAALQAAGGEAVDPYELEHVTPFVYRRPERFRLDSIARAPSLAHLRWTVDLPEDLDFVRYVYAALYPVDPAFRTEQIAQLPRNSSSAVTL